MKGKKWGEMLFKRMRHCLLLVVAVAGCGNYCGKYMCGGELVFDDSCDYSVTPLGSAAFEGDAGDACVDACCRAHDTCCDADGTHDACNTIIVDCLATCDPWASACWYGVMPVPAWLVRRVFQVVENWSCGTMS